MNPENSPDPKERGRSQEESREREFRLRIRRKLERHQKAQREKKDLLFGLGVFGVVGWSVAVPTLIGIAIGVWLDKNWSGPISWTLMFLLAGVLAGCLNAWFWIDASNRRK